LYISVFVAPVAGQPDPDALYADRANLASARQAADLLAREFAVNVDSFDAAWKLARIAYWLGGHAPDNERRGFLERGVTAAERARSLQPNRPEGHFWSAAAMGAIAEDFGMRAGMKYRKPIKEALETVIKIDPAFMNGSADRALGRWYHKVPRLFGGSRKEAEAHLRASLAYDPNSTLSHLFLGELLLDEGRKAEARAEFEAVVQAPLSKEWAPEDVDYKRQAGERLTRLR
jgi:tetratricopeptide (TPR) repeat protein